MQVLVVSTDRASLRDEIWGWSWEDSKCYVHDKPIGLSPSWDRGINRPEPTTVLQALAEGWKLLSAPAKYTYSVSGQEWWEWWLTRG